MAQPHRTPLPAILLANDLLEGDVVFRTASGWSRDPAAAFIAEDEAGAQKLVAEGEQAFRNNEVVDATLVDVARDASGAPVPRHFRERFKISGPSHRTDLGKQAEFRRGTEGA